MENFVRIVMEKNEKVKILDESIFPKSEVYESEQGASIIEIPLDRLLDEQEATEYANRLANYMFEQGYEDFDIEISTDLTDELDEETYDDDDEFYEEYGMMWYNEDDDPMDEAEYRLSLIHI